MADADPDFPPEPFANIDGMAAAFLHTLRETFGHHDEIVGTGTPQRLFRVNNTYEKASGGWEIDFQGSLSGSDTPKRLEETIEERRRDAFLSWLDSKPFPDAEEIAADLRAPDAHRMANLYAYAAEYLGKDRFDVDCDARRSYWQVYHELDDSLRDDFNETEQEWLNGSYWYACKLLYMLPTDTGSLWDEPVVRIELEFSDDEYIRRSDTIGGFTITVDAFREGLLPLLATRIINVFQEQ